MELLPDSSLRGSSTVTDVPQNVSAGFYCSFLNIQEISYAVLPSLQ